MPDAAQEIVYTAFAKPPSWGERLIHAHTPEAHYQDIMKKYFRVTDRLEGRPREIVQRLRPQIELAAKAAGWSQTFAELYLAGSALALTTIIAGKGLKTAAEVFGGMGRRHGGKVLEEAASVAVKTTIVTEADDHLGKELTPPIVLGPTVQPKHISSARMEGFEQVTQRIKGDGRETGPPPPAKPRSADVPHFLRNKVAHHHPLSDLERVMMRKIGNQAHIFGEYLKAHLRDISDDQRRHTQRAYAYMLQGLLSKDAKTSSGSTDPREAFLAALAATKTRGEGLSDGSIDQVFAALQQFNTLKSTT